MINMIVLENISKIYGDVAAVTNNSLNINHGEICVLLGPSGCGKSTTIRMINKLIEPSEGNIYIDNKDINDYSIEKLRRNIGYVVQSTGLFPHMTVKSNIATVPKLLKWSKQEINKRIEELLELVGLDPEKYQKKYPHELSGGEAQRVGVARALAADPPILLMDEPFGAVDPLNRKRLQNEFLKIQQKLKKTVVFVTHDVEEAIKMGTKIAVMNKGNIEEYDTPEGLILKQDNPFVKKFLGEEYAVKILSKFKAKEYMNKPACNNLESKYFIEEEDSLQTALSYMIQNSLTTVFIKDTKLETIGEIDVKNIVNILKEIGESRCQKN